MAEKCRLQAGQREEVDEPPGDARSNVWVEQEVWVVGLQCDVLTGVLGLHEVGENTYLTSK